MCSAPPLCSARLNPSSSPPALFGICHPQRNNQLSKNAPAPHKVVSNLISLTVLLSLLVHSFPDSCERLQPALTVGKCWPKNLCPTGVIPAKDLALSLWQVSQGDFCLSCRPFPPRPSYKHYTHSCPSLLK